MCRFMWVILALGVGAAGAVGCGDGETEADRIGVGAECTENLECVSANEDIALQCLTQFAGGYCGLQGCEGAADCSEETCCPEGSACVTADDGENYCYRLCQEKPDCNRNRPTNPANCVGSGTINFVDGDTDRKACEPPSSGT